MSEVGREIAGSLARLEEDELLKSLSAKKGEITQRKDLAHYSFQCSCCKETKPATEAVLLKTEPEIKWESPEELEEKVLVNVSQKIALICQDCRIKYFKTEGGGEGW